LFGERSPTIVQDARIVLNFRGFAAMCRSEKAMTAFILALIVTCLVFGPRPVGVFFAILLAAALARPRGDRGDIMH
jgi:hypothetical protein